MIAKYNAVDRTAEMITVQLWKSTASTCCRLFHWPIHARIYYSNFQKCATFHFTSRVRTCQPT